MNNVIMITIYNRPECLYINLEQLFKNPEIYNFKIRLYADYGYDKESYKVMRHFDKIYKHNDIRIVAKKQKYVEQLPGMHNVLTSYELAANETSAFVIVLEEDIIPTEDFLRFNIYAYEHFLKKYPRIFCVSHKRRAENELEGDPEVLIGDNQCPLPTCITKENIYKYIAPHIQDELFTNQIAYHHKHFPQCRIHLNTMSHNDVFLERIIDVNNMFALKPDQTRSMHIGLSGASCRGDNISGTLMEKVNQYKYLMKHPDELRAKSFNYPHAMVTTDPKGPQWNTLKLDPYRNIAKASSWWYDKTNEFGKYILGKNYDDTISVTQVEKYIK